MIPVLCYYYALSSARQTSISEIIIPSITPYFLERGPLWFRENQNRIKRAHQHNEQFWGDNIIVLKEGGKVSLSEILRTLTEFGYEKAQRLSRPGEYSLAGGVLHIFPLGSDLAYVIDLLGNTIERIHAREIAYEEKDFKKGLKSRLDKESLKNLKPGDYLVHLDHGIARFSGTKRYTLSPTPYYVLEYAGGDRLFVPVGLERKLSRYIGFTEPKLSRLGSPLWDRAKRKVREDAIKTAKELIRIYAKRELARRPPHEGDSRLEQEVASSFPFRETLDQELAIKEVERDLSRATRPMDRVVAGDVGFGKTEVALRASVLVASSGKQVAMLAPTTILADQHFHTFCERLATTPLEVAQLSRIQTKNEQAHVLKKLGAGTVDIVIGTHRLLSRDVRYKDLGLLIIDEEQKFGVRQKERFKEIRAELDILSLSATPIPRTLYLALSNLRAISIIQTPPPDRVPVETRVLPWKKNVIARVISREISRGGQIYYLHNRVGTIERAKRELQTLLPFAKIGVAHGKLPESKLLAIMHDMREKKIDVLVATTIIENGLDLPNVNTLIVANATRLGLSQAYQIRGRIGRSHAQAYAYFLYPERSAEPAEARVEGLPLSEKASQRLMALKEATELGSGYQIALRDLEIRGAGNILGKEQSGSVNRVGLNLYCQILAEATEELQSRNDKSQNPNDKSSSND